MASQLLSSIFGLDPLLITQVWVGIMLVMSLFTFFAYGWDKRSAEKGNNRVPEKSLHLLELLGGWPGAIAGQKFFRHKTQKKLFLLLTYLMAAINVFIAGSILWLAWS